MDTNTLQRSKKVTPVGDQNFARLWRQFGYGLLWISFWAAMIVFATGVSFIAAFLVMLALALGGGGVALFWVARWAERDDAPVRRFSVATLLLGTAYVAAFLGCVRWLLVASAEYHGRSSELPPLEFMVVATILCLFLLWASMPLLLGLLDSVMWSAVWLIKRRWLRKTLMQLKRTPTVKPSVEPVTHPKNRGI